VGSGEKKWLAHRIRSKGHHQKNVTAAGIFEYLMGIIWPHITIEGTKIADCKIKQTVVCFLGSVSL
jgi:hypothetical protein